MQRLLRAIKEWFFIPEPKIPADDPSYIMYQLYRNVDGVSLSHAERDRLQINDTSFTYGEVTQLGLAECLNQVSPQSGEIFYDLGSGTGRAVIAASLLYDWKKCVGIEYLPALYQMSQELKKKILQMDAVKNYYSHKTFALQFICDDILCADFSDADIIFVNAATYNAVLWGHLVKQFEKMKIGTRIIVGTRKLEEPHFQLLHQSLYPMSWGECTVFIYQKK